MPTIPVSDHGKLQARLKAMLAERQPWEATWTELSDFFLPRRYLWLLSEKERKSAGVRNRKLLDSTSIIALRTLSTGMMNGITSPARPWFRLTRPTVAQDEEVAYKEAVWLDAAGKKMLYVMAQTNFYNAVGILYLEWPTFGTAGMSIYEDPEMIFRCHNYAIGEFCITCDQNGEVVGLGREFSLSAENALKMFGREACSARILADYDAGGVRRSNLHSICHLCIENEGFVRPSAPFADIYWEKAETGRLLRKTPVDEWPNITPRWEVYAGDYYGSSPCMDALPDVIQLQHLIKRRSQGLDKTVSPPMLFNQMLANRPRSTLPGGETFVPGGDLNAGARPLYQIQIPFQELNLDISATKDSIRNVLYNPLFTAISNLSTVRSATEVEAITQEKLVLLGPVRDRFENEALTPAIQRIFSICRRAGIFGPEPESLRGIDLQVRYTSPHADAQRAVGTASIERYLQLIGNMVAIYPDEVVAVPNPEEIIREYADAINLPTRLQRSRAEVEQIKAGQAQKRSLQEAAQTGGALVAGAQQLSETDLGGGVNALQAALA